MNKYIIGATIAFAGAALVWFCHRLYKRVARRCRKKNCGRTGVKRVRKILLAPDEAVSWRSPGLAGKRRWWIRRVIKLTFAVCKCGWIELVKIDNDPISLWHAYWVQWFYKEQYHLGDQPLIEATQRKARQLYLGGRAEKLDSQATDTPPLSLNTLFRDWFEELSEIIGND